MNAITVTAVVGEDGVLHVDVPLGAQAASKEVRLTIAPVSKPRFTKEEWARIVDNIAGKGQGEFERPAQGEYEVRDPM